MFVMAIKDLKVRLDNSNLFIEKHKIWFKLLAQKKETGNKGLVYYITNTKNLFHRNVCLSGKNLG